MCLACRFILRISSPLEQRAVCIKQLFERLADLQVGPRDGWLQQAWFAFPKISDLSPVASSVALGWSVIALEASENAQA